MKRPLLAGFLGFSVFVLSYFFIPGNASQVSANLKVARITPAGDAVADLSQVVFEFDRDVVALGEMKRSSDEIPITFTPQVKCEWRWLNATTLSCNLDAKNALSLATHYKVTVRPGLVALDNTQMTASFKHEFTTQLPGIEYVYLETWKSPQRPKIRFWTTQPVTAQSLENVLRFVKKDGGGFATRVKVEEVPENDHKYWMVEPTSDLPKATDLVLQLNPGLASLSGPKKSTETRALLSMSTFADFAFVGVECTTNLDKTIRISDGQSAKMAEQLCNPMASVSLLFNAPVARGEVLKRLQVTPQVKLGSHGEIGYNEIYMLQQNHQRDDVYRVDVPGLKPAQYYVMRSKLIDATDQGLQDLFQRKITNSIEASLSTDHFKPRLNVPYEYAVLELNSASDVPIGVTNLKSWDFKFHGFNSAGEITEQTFNQLVPQVLDSAFSMPAKIRDRLGNKSGVVFGRFTSESIPRKGEDFGQQLFAEVTPYQLHVKVGHFNTLVWVTDLATGQVVSDANVMIYADAISGLHATNKPLAQGKTDSQGIAILPGTDVIDPKLDLSYSYELGSQRLFVRVDKGGHIAVLPMVYEFEVSLWRASKNGDVNDHLRRKDGHVVTWGTTAQGIYKLGDKVQYKIYVRNQNNETLTAAPKTGYSLQIQDPTGKTVHEVTKLKLSEFGAVDGEFTVSKQGAVGWYQFQMTSLADTETQYQPMRVLVSDFTPAPFKVTQDLNGDLFQAGQAVSVTTNAKLHSGGAYSEASTRVTASVERAAFVPKTNITQGFEFSSAQNEERFKEVYQSVAPLNKDGELKSQFVLPPLGIYYGDLKVESAVQDDRGKNIATHSQAQYVGVDRFVGLKRTDWDSSTSKPIDVNYIVVDAKGDPAKGSSVTLVFEHEETSIARIKDVGTTYTTQVTTQWKPKAVCKAVSTLEVLSCQFKPAVSGIYRVTATVKDTQDREQISQTSFWVSGKEAFVWDNKNENFLEIVAEKLTAVVGDKARFLIKNPYPNAKALITVERFGVIDRFVKTLDSSSPIIEIPIKENYLPGFYLSVTIQSPRVAKAPQSGQLDLGKPTFSMGYIRVPVVDRYKEISVTAKVEREVYRPRDKVKVTIHAQPKMKAAKHEPIELAVAVVDESVFDLLSGGNANYDPYNGLYQFDQIDLRNYSLLTRLIGLQKFEAKGANPGGDGGVDFSMRTVFKYVSHWQPSLRTDSNGNASVEFEAPDNLTGWRVLVMAVTPSDRAGLGVANFKVNRPTEVRPVMPNQVVEGDMFKAGFSVMNRSDQRRQIKVSIKATGAIDATATPGEFAQVLDLAPYQRASVLMPVHVLKKGDSIRFVVRAGDSIDTDGTLQDIAVHKNRTILTAAIYGTTTQKQVAQPLIFPTNIYTDVGSVDVNLSSSVIASVEGAFKYLRDYPYTCWEQRLSKAVMAENYLALKAHVPKEFVWAESATLAQNTLDVASNFQASNGGMCYFGASDDYADPYLSAYTALAFTWLKQAGKSVPSAVEAKLHTYLLNYLRRDASPEHYSEAMTATVRATALAALASQSKITLTDLTRFAPQFGKMNLLGRAHFISAALATAGAEKMSEELLEKLLAKSTQSSGKFMLSEVSGADGFERILSTPLRNNCAALSTLTQVAKKQGLESVKDIPFKLVRTITETRKGREYWENTQENLFCMQALADYSRVYESDRTNMKVKVRLDSEAMGAASFDKPTATPMVLSRPIQQNDPGKKSTLFIEREGEGRLYYTSMLSTASRNAGDTSVNAGMDLKRQYSVMRDKKWVTLKSPMKIMKGEVIRVDLYLSLMRPGNFVVINDPIPGGLEPVNQNLATSSSVDLDARNPSESGRWSFYHRELHNDVARFYSDYLSKGSYHLFYTAQAVAEGTFTAKAPLAQEMYNPDIQGRDVSLTLNVGATH